MSNCMRWIIFFTCVSFVLYLKFIKDQIYYGLIFYLSLNDELEISSRHRYNMLNDTTNSKERRKERMKERKKEKKKERKKERISKTASYKLKTIMTRFQTITGYSGKKF